MNLELIKNIIFIIVSIVACFGIIIFYYKIWRLSIKIREINNEIEEKYKMLNQLNIESIKSDGDWEINIGKDNKKDKQEIRKLEHSTESLCREKIYYLEEISIYKLFKK